MKNLLILLLFAPLSLMAEPPNIGAITRAISSGDAAALGQFFDETVEIATPDSEDMYSKSDAIQKVRQFFNSAKPQSFSQVHQGASKGQDSQYFIGNLVAGNGKYRVYIYMKVKGSNSLIQELRFDRE
ncbi:MAG: DUF4783 domain-containing protein [Saprospiraceae bacterium]|jgi:hypothetical protein